MNRNKGLGWTAAALLAFTAGTAALAGAGLAQAGQAGQASHAMHHGMGHAGMRGDPAAMEAHFDKMFAEMLPDGSPDQKARLKAIVTAVHADLDGIHGQLGQTHSRLHALLLQPRVDRAALEALRAEQVRQIDQTSRRVVQALADAAEVLTPEQRARVAAHLKADAH